jgi:ubiquinone/menaquinone biosynthesis C-methylase UbiE
MRFFQQLLRRLLPAPSPAQIAAQLRRPSGRLGRKVGLKMNESNAALHAFALDVLQLQPGERLLEIGFGNGRLFESSLRRAAGLRVWGLDFSADMCRQARQNAAAFVREGQLHLHLGSSAAMPFADASFDKVLCVNVIYFWDDPAPHLAEIRRVLRPGGLFVAAFRSREVMEKLPFTAHGFRLYAPGEWSETLAAQGFAVVATQQREEPPIVVQGQAQVLTGCCVAGLAPAF